jgi:tRNA uridine 5-carboxymethylaminomethyl modification enzyme
MKKYFDVIVIGGGHAGIEAAQASARMGMKTCLFSMSMDAFGRPSCNPSIGGSAKGHIVKEIDALGGYQSQIADMAGIHFKMLNTSKGPAIWSPRAQIDKDLYPKMALQLLQATANLTLLEGSVKEVLIDNYKATGVIAPDGSKIEAKAVILCAGTFLNGLMFTGDVVTEGGRHGEPSSYGLSDMLKAEGFALGRLKTGTPPRVSAESIDYDKVQIEKGDENPEPFSYKTKSVQNQIVCYGTATNLETHDILRTGFDASPLFQGRIKGAGPRYCPSIEDKINRFSDRDSHKILMEPEGLNTNSYYVNGFSTSLSVDVQMKGLHSIPGLEHCEMIRPGYAIEYDFFFPYQLRFTLETKDVSGLYFAGQVNGTSGYEEAAGQGLVAGINAALKIREEEPFVLKRSESYIGVLIDDLVNKSTEEPYRMFTSLAEYRLLLRQDNADLRLSEYGYKFGLVDKEHYDEVMHRKQLLAESPERAKKLKVSRETLNSYLEPAGESPVPGTTDLYSIAKRSKVKFDDLLTAISESGELNDELLSEIAENPKAMQQLGFELKYEGYIKRQMKEIEYFLNNESKYIPDNFDYSKVSSISNEAREKLQKIRPGSLGQASRISGVSAADISVLSLFLK